PLARQRADQCVLPRLARLGAVEIDHMHPFGARVRERTELGLGFAILGHGVKTPLREAHAAPGAQIDGGSDQHGRLKKLARMRAPAAPERSGWTRRPTTLSRAGMAANGAP